MNDDREKGGGAAVLIVVGFLVVVLAMCGGGGFYYVRHLQMLHIMEAVRAERAADEAEQRAQAALEYADAERRAADDNSASEPYSHP